MWVGRISRALQTIGETMCILGVCQDFFIAWIAAQHVDVIAECFCIGSISAEFLYTSLRYAVDIFDSVGFNYLATPITTCLDAKQIVRRTTVACANFFLAPASFKRGLSQHEFGWNTSHLARQIGICLQARLKCLNVSRSLHTATLPPPLPPCEDILGVPLAIPWISLALSRSLRLRNKGISTSVDAASSSVGSGLLTLLDNWRANISARPTPRCAIFWLSC